MAGELGFDSAVLNGAPRKTKSEGVAIGAATNSIDHLEKPSWDKPQACFLLGCFSNSTVRPAEVIGTAETQSRHSVRSVAMQCSEPRRRGPKLRRESLAKRCLGPITDRTRNLFDWHAGL